jgi:phytoene synthase
LPSIKSASPVTSQNFVSESINTSLEVSYQFCRELSRAQARNFYWSFRLLDHDRRRAMCSIYAFMRQTDDIADAPGMSQAARSEALENWRHALDQCLKNDRHASAQASWSGFPALADTVSRYEIPPRYLHAVIDGMKWDLGAVRIQTEAEFEEYCWHVASAVGLCCLYIWGFDPAEGRAEALASRLGLAFQRTNILRDVAEDYANNRVYLPASLMLKYGVRLSDLGLPTALDSLKKLVLDQAAVARSEYQSAQELQQLVKPSGRPMLRAISRIYEGVLDQIERQGGEVLAQRARISNLRKFMIMCRSFAN